MTPWVGGVLCVDGGGGGEGGEVRCWVVGDVRHTYDSSSGRERILERPLRTQFAERLCGRSDGADCRPSWSFSGGEESL